MTVYIKQTVEQVAPAVYDVTITREGADPIRDTYEKTNAVFPAYRSLFKELYKCRGCDVLLTTNSVIAREFNDAENQNTRLLQQLKEIQAQYDVKLTVEYADN